MSQPVSTLKLQINLSDENWVDPVAAKRLYRGSPYALLLTFVKNNQTIEAGSDVAFIILDHSTGDQVIAINGTQTDAKGESRVDIAEGQIDFDGDYQAIISVNNSKAADFPLTISGVGSPVPPPATVIDWSAYSGYANTANSGPYLFTGDGQTTSEDAQGRVTVNIPDGGAGKATQQDLDNAIATRLPLAGGTMSGDINMGENSLTNVHAVVFEPDGAAPTKGLLAFDDERQSLKYYDEDLNLILVGENVVIRVRNVEGATINKGQIVFISGATGGNVEVKLAGASMPGVNCCIGVILSDSINNNASGKMVTTGRLSGINTSGFTEGQTIWLSDTPGEFTATPPALPSRRIRVGVVARVHQTEGVIQVSSVRNYDAEIDEKADDADVVKLTGNQNISGEKTFINVASFAVGAVSNVLVPVTDNTGSLGGILAKWAQGFINTIRTLVLRAQTAAGISFQDAGGTTRAIVKSEGLELTDKTASRPLYLDANKIIQTPTAEQFREDIGAIEDAPEDGKQYAREDGAWTEVEAVATEVITDSTTARTLQAGDANNVVAMTSASANTVTIPAGVFDAGTIINIVQIGEGETVIEGATNVDVNGVEEGFIAIGQQFGAVSLLKLDSGSWQASATFDLPRQKFVDLTLDGNKSLRLEAGDMGRIEVKGNHTLTMVAPVNSTVPGRRATIFKQDATGDRTVTLAGPVKTAGGLQINLVGAANSETAYYWDWDGTHYVEAGVAFDTKEIV